MKTLVIAASLAAAIAGTVPALAQQRGPDHHAQPMTRADVQAKVKERFAQVDANHDGVVTKAEFDAYRSKAQADREAKRGERRAEMFARLDTNKDGQISQAEFAARPDRGPDGADAPGGHGRMGMRGGMHHGGMGGWGGWGGPNGDRRAEGFFAAMDANHDGKVTLAEATAKPLAMFDKADANHDGIVTPEERRAAWGAMRAEWKGRRG